VPVSQYPTPKPFISYTYANAAARIAAGEEELAPEDIGRFVFQSDNETVWRLVSLLPAVVWSQEPNGPRFNRFRDLKPEYPSTVVKVMKSGSANYSTPEPTPILRWEMSYANKRLDADRGPAWNILPLDAHNAEALDVALGFAFRHPRTGVLYNDVHYETYDTDQEQRVIRQIRRVVLIKRPS
jgi:hypothetical protein